MSDGPKKYSTEPTLVIPRESLAPVSRPIHVEIVDDEREIDRDAETLVECPCCDGQGMVTVQRRGELAARFAPVLDDPGETP